MNDRQEPLLDPAYHAGRSAYEWREGKGAVPEWAVSLDGPKATLVCPRCDGSTDVDYQAWMEGRDVLKGTRTRPCPYCIKVSLLPR